MDKTKLMAWIIVLLMAFSIFGYVGGTFFSEDDENKEEYNGFTFYNQGASWKVNINEEDYVFQYFPTELENISIPIDLKNWNNLGKIYLAYYPNDTIKADIQFSYLGSIFYKKNIMPQKACMIEEGCPDIPIMDCSNKAGIIVHSGEENYVTSKGNCLEIVIDNIVDLQKITERISYDLLGVMN